MKFNLTILFLFISCTLFAQKASVQWSDRIPLTDRITPNPSTVEFIGEDNAHLFILYVKDHAESQYFIQKVDKASFKVIKEIPCKSRNFTFRKGMIDLFSFSSSPDRKNFDYHYTGYDLDLNEIKTKKSFLSVPQNLCGKYKGREKEPMAFSYNEKTKHFLIQRPCAYYFLDTTLTLVKELSNIRQDVFSYYLTQNICTSEDTVISVIPDGTDKQRGRLTTYTVEVDGKKRSHIALKLPEKSKVQVFRTFIPDDGSTLVLVGLYGTKDRFSEGLFINKFDLYTGNLLNHKFMPYTPEMQVKYHEDFGLGSMYEILSFKMNGTESISLNLGYTNVISPTQPNITTYYGFGPLYYLNIPDSGQMTSTIIIEGSLLKTITTDLSVPLISNFDDKYYYLFNDRMTNHQEFASDKWADKKRVIGIHTLNTKDHSVQKKYLEMPDDASDQIIFSGRAVMTDAKHIFLLVKEFRSFRYGYITLE